MPGDCGIIAGALTQEEITRASSKLSNPTVSTSFHFDFDIMNTPFF